MSGLYDGPPGRQPKSQAQLDYEAQADAAAQAMYANNARSGGPLPLGMVRPAAPGLPAPQPSLPSSGSVGGGGGGSVAGGGGGGGIVSSSISADTYAPLTALQDRYNQMLTNFEGNTGAIADIVGQRVRQAREGGRKSLMQGDILAGKAGSPALSNYETGTTRGVQQAITDFGTDRERTLMSALQGGLGIARAPAELALQEKGLTLNAANAAAAQEYQRAQLQQAAAAQQFQQMLALLNAQRSSPQYEMFY